MQHMVGSLTRRWLQLTLTCRTPMFLLFMRLDPTTPAHLMTHLLEFVLSFCRHGTMRLGLADAEATCSREQRTANMLPGRVIESSTI